MSNLMVGIIVCIVVVVLFITLRDETHTGWDD